jgi:hypothetical protein
VLTALIVADLTMGTGRFNLAQGVVGTMSGVGASLSTTFQASWPEASAAQRDSLASQQLLWSLSSSCGCGCLRPISRIGTSINDRSFAA